ncbi:bifunctional lytic transglycosylase/C40 family peptidase [Nocardiopsis sp. N85]|uniref:C40 family peptidase n=1 Tax=Nocardiopsis sp. N85 TaxID=3029400 RepID=UPI00237F7BF1|nr:bifunctional lytic transglycosylase/C40 family peptidase [Nocardiopsis sp. N85]MDE3721439.1 bifunctional lytic transglycosylase/C40 family peptidase [Nocardiopsis sp. N85]
MAAAGFLFLVPVLFIGAMGNRGEYFVGVPGEVEGIPAPVLEAYVLAAVRLEGEYEQCRGMTWPVLAGIGGVESDHVAGKEVSASGDVRPAMVGPRLDGSGVGGNTTPHWDSDGGELDGDSTYDRAVGPMQFLPATWATHGLDGNGDGVADPHNVHDAVWSAAVYLCVSEPESKPVDFSEEDDLEAALLRYNRAGWYVDKVHGHIDAYTEIAAQAAAQLPVVRPGAGTEHGRAAAAWALAQVGRPYVWGGTGPHGFDCSGLAMQAWKAAGVSLPRVTTDQVNAGTRVGLGELQAGDLLFYDTGGPGGSPSHVTLYVGEGQMVNAPRTGQNIRVDSVDNDYYRSVFVAAVRPG